MHLSVRRASAAAVSAFLALTVVAIGANPFSPAPAGAASTVTWTVTGACGTVASTTAPAGATSMTVVAVGAKGGKGGQVAGATGGSGAIGGKVTGTVPVTAGQTVSAVVGCAGTNGSSGSGPGGAGFSTGGGGGQGHGVLTSDHYGGGGGGSSAVCTSATCLNGAAAVTPVVVAGGGAGGGSLNCAGTSVGAGGNGGAGSVTSNGLGAGASGANGGSGLHSNGGGGGVNANAGGANGSAGGNGSQGSGTNSGGGGGGGGYRGGAGGSGTAGGAALCAGGGGGGGGSSWVSTAGVPTSSFSTDAAAGVTVTFTIPSTVPGAPTNPVGTAGDGQITASWTAPASNGGSPITGYRVTPLTIGGPLPARIFTSTATSQVITGLDNGGEYSFRVAAINAIGPGPDSTDATAVMPQAPVDHVPFATLDELIEQQYQDFLGRPPTAAELTRWHEDITAGTATADDLVVALLPTDQTTVDAQVVRLYLAYFLRPPDRPGFAYWVGVIEGGRPLQVVSNQFAATREFTERYGSLTNRQFVELIYQNVLGREAEPSGRDFWTEQLDGNVRTRGWVMTYFSESVENQARKAGHVGVVRTYLAMLERMPTKAELLTAVAPPSATVLTRTAHAIRHSAEYAGRVVP